MVEEPNFERYSNLELADILENIDRGSYPERFKQLCLIMENRGILLKDGQSFEPNYDIIYRTSSLIGGEKQSDSKASNIGQKPRPAFTAKKPQPKYDVNGTYIPNTVPLDRRLMNSFFSLCIIAYGVYGLLNNSLWIPLTRSLLVELNGIAAFIMLISILSGAIMLLAEVVDHYDKRDNEMRYFKVARFFRNVAYGAFSTAIICGLFTGAQFQST
ncbi:MAG: hypothetical protein GJ680_14915 [Alteromonadaceae bacterium]|nr:hypothetical protein [Alteromonadaceae bacterium]